MKIETKVHLMTYTDSYWTLLPVVVEELILQYKDSQELIEWRESVTSRELCEQIVKYGVLREKWALGFIQCRPARCQSYSRLYSQSYSVDPCKKCMRIYGFYWDKMCVKRKCLLASDLDMAIANCNYRKVVFANIWASFPRE